MSVADYNLLPSESGEDGRHHISTPLCSTQVICVFKKELVYNYVPNFASATQKIWVPFESLALGCSSVYVYGFSGTMTK